MRSSAQPLLVFFTNNTFKTHSLLAALMGKLDYIHNNPVKAGLCQHPWEYKYSSAGSYLKKDTTWNFLVHIDG
ncbi:MAG: hypothetical protein KF803_00300 [Cyclobacteriaceae bacterium]|nr:hypothetical protein [Cyclobacteriaceae bacterium]